MKKKVAILGYVTHYTKAPFGDPEFEIWGINDMFRLEGVQRWDRWFQIHHPTHYGVGPGRLNIEESLGVFAGWECPVYLWQAHPGVKNSLSFPFRELIEKYGDYFNNTISWLIAFAIHEGFEEIHLYGVDMASDSEYGHQKPSCEYFLGLARGMGIKVYVPPESDLLKTRFLYAYEADKIDRRNIRLREKLAYTKVNLQKVREEEERVKAARYQYEGAIQALQEIHSKDF